MTQISAHSERPKNPIRILISACLLGQPVRYDGKANDSKIHSMQPLLEQWQRDGWLVPVCPELLGGLPTPRAAAEIQQGDGLSVLNGQATVITRSGENVTQAFLSGAQRALELAQQHGACAALLAARSPSCGSNGIYDGHFSATLRSGQGVTVALLEQHGIRCFTPEQSDQLQQFLQTIKP